MLGYDTIYVINGHVYRNGYDACKYITYLAGLNLPVTITRRQVQKDTTKHNCLMTLVEWFKW